MFRIFPTLVLIAVLSAPASGATLAHYAFDGATFADSAGFAQVTATNLAPGAAASTDDGFSTFSTPFDGGSHSLFPRGTALRVTDNVTSAAFATATSQGNYLEFTLTSVDLMNLTSLGFDTAKNTGNPHDLRVIFTSDITGHTYADRLDIAAPAAADTSLADVIQSNIAGNMSDVVTGTGTDWGFADNGLVDLSGASFQGIGSVTFRVYGFAINAPTASTSDILRFDNILVNGAVVPEPSAGLLALLGMSGFALARRRRS